MKIKAKTISAPIEVEISHHEIIDQTICIIKNKYKQFDSHDYIDKGVWQLFDGANPHNGDFEYIKGNTATEEELKINEILNFLKKL